MRRTQASRTAVKAAHVFSFLSARQTEKTLVWCGHQHETMLLQRCASHVMPWDVGGLG